MLSSEQAEKQQEDIKSRAGFQSHRPQQEEIKNLNDSPFPQLPGADLVRSSLKMDRSILSTNHSLPLP